jgi:hypothetical protein
MTPTVPIILKSALKYKGLRFLLLKSHWSIGVKIQAPLVCD